MAADARSRSLATIIMAGLAYLYAEPQSDAPAHLVDKLEEQAAKQWDNFYTRNADKFYKDRHYFEKEWPALCAGPAALLEVGCGVGNTAFPLLALNPALTVHACDFSAVAVDIVKAHPAYAAGRVQAFVADLTCTDLCMHVPTGAMDFVTMVFVLSAVTPHKMPTAVANVARTLRPGGQLLFRDYEQGDLVQELRESAARRLGERFFARGDGTRCFHFESRELCGLMAAAGLTCRGMKVHEREVENRKRGIVMRRRWLQAVFEKTSASPAFPPAPGSMPIFPPPAHARPSPDTNTSNLAQGVQQQTTYDGMDSAMPDDPFMDEDYDAHDVPHGTPRDLQQPASDSKAASGDYGATLTAVAVSNCSSSREGGGIGRSERGSGGGKQGVSSPSVTAVSSPAAGLLSASWLTGAAGRLASHAGAPPGMQSGRALLPETLDSADEVVSLLSPATNRRLTSPHNQRTSSMHAHQHEQPQHPLHQPMHGEAEERMEAVSVAGADKGVAKRLCVDQLEADLEREFFETVARDTEEVVAEEAAAAGLAGIRLEDPTPTLGRPLLAQPLWPAHEQQPQPQPQPQQAGNSFESPSDDTMTDATQAITLNASDQTSSSMDVELPYRTSMGGNDGSSGDGSIANLISSASGSVNEVEVEVVPGLRLLCPDPNVARAMPLQLSQLASPPVVPRTGAGSAFEAIETVQLELLLARLLVACGEVQAGSALVGLLSGKTLLQVSTGPGALVGMSTVRRCGVRRALLTHTSRLCVHALARCVHANASRLVVERLKVAQLDWTQQATVRNVLTRLAAQGGVDVVVCGDIHGACRATRAGEVRALMAFAAMAARGEQPASESAVRSIRTSSGGGASAGEGREGQLGKPGLETSDTNGLVHAANQLGVAPVERQRHASMVLLVGAEQPAEVWEAGRASGWVLDKHVSVELAALWAVGAGGTAAASLVKPVLLRLLP